MNNITRGLSVSLLAFGLALAAPAAAQAAELVVIVNKSNSTAALNAKQAKNYFMKVVADWSGGEKVRPVDVPTAGAVRNLFLSKLVGLSAGEFERYWIEKQYASAENPPVKAPDEATVIKLVSTLKGGIGFVSKEALASANSDGVKPVLSITQ